MRKIEQVFCERKVDMVLLRETKRSTIDEKFVRSIWGIEQMDFMAVDSAEVAGGLLCIWNPEVFQLVDCCSNMNFIILSGTLYNSFDCVILNIYVPNDLGVRKVVWDSLVRLKLVYNKPWCLGGDFNEIKNISERKGCSRQDKGMKEFNELIDKLEVADLPMMGRNLPGAILKRGRNGVELTGSCLIQNGYKCLISSFGGCLGRSFVENTWLEANVVGWVGFKCLQKLKILKLALKQWDKEVFGDVKHKLNQVEEEIHALDISAEERPLSEAKQARRR
ncbi:uncharacterized protein LOC114311546 [Camellia sinensis]|uniref:uncharacterized protein LOC114311546 n=1 Tax=Camellia sinensis TaxID=4442 RepID=UPI001036A90F|nr:uncharacterized protein LOC114311546 [Camellia sinensis]